MEKSLKQAYLASLVFDVEFKVQRWEIALENGEKIKFTNPLDKPISFPYTSKRLKLIVNLKRDK